MADYTKDELQLDWGEIADGGGVFFTDAEVQVLEDAFASVQPALNPFCSDRDKRCIASIIRSIDRVGRTYDALDDRLKSYVEFYSQFVIMPPFDDSSGDLSIWDHQVSVSTVLSELRHVLRQTGGAKLKLGRKARSLQLNEFVSTVDRVWREAKVRSRKERRKPCFQKFFYGLHARLPRDMQKEITFEAWRGRLKRLKPHTKRL